MAIMEAPANTPVWVDESRCKACDVCVSVCPSGVLAMRPEPTSTLGAMIKIVAPNMACRVVDRAIQCFGGKGVSGDTPLAGFYAAARTLRLADGPDEVHMYQLGRNTVKQHLMN